VLGHGQWILAEHGARTTVRACAVAGPAVLADPAAVPGLSVADANGRMPAARGTRDMEAQAAWLEREQVVPAAAARRAAFRRLTNPTVGANATRGDRASETETLKVLWNLRPASRRFASPEAAPDFLLPLHAPSRGALGRSGRVFWWGP